MDHFDEAKGGRPYGKSQTKKQKVCIAINGRRSSQPKQPHQPPFLYGFKVQILQINPQTMLHQVPPQQFKAFVVPIEQNGILFFSELEHLDGFGSHGLNLLIGRLKPLILLHCQQLLGQSFNFLLPQNAITQQTIIENIKSSLQHYR